MKKTRIFINGYGRIGRVLHRIMLRAGEKNLIVAGINSRADAASHAHLLKYDSTYGILEQKVSYGKNYIKVDGWKIKVFENKNPGEINFQKEGVDIVAECTGKFKDGESCRKQIDAGAKKVVISAPGKNDDICLVLGVNQNLYSPKKHQIVSNASCTTNALAVIIKVLQDKFGITFGQMTTIHALTRSQNILDGSHEKSLRIARAAIDSFIPSTTGASEVINLIFPELSGKMNAMAVRVPFSTVSLIDLVVLLKKRTTTKSLNKTFRQASETKLKNVLGFTMEPLVSVDFKGECRSAVVDGLSTNVIGNQLAKVLAWYDNEWGYCCRLYDILKLVAGYF